ncbi:MAG: TolC family protein [Elusimicrobia bacterium]|nr:TolC family protein [Elusimicrobiota bacterium]
MRSYLLIPLLAAMPAASYAQTLTLDDAAAAVLKANPQAQASASDLRAAESRLSAARAGFYPSFSANASYSRSGTQGFDPGDSYSYGFSGRQPLFSAGIPAAVRSAAASRDSAKASYDRTVSALTYQLKTAFADILNARETVKLSSETIRRREENLDLIRLKYQAGRENKAALLETEAALKTAKWQDGRYRKDLLLLERKLDRLLGRPLTARVPELSLPPAQEPPADLSAFAGRLRGHYSLRTARAAVESAKASGDSAAGARLPEAYANGSYGWNGTDWPRRDSSWAVGASLSLPLFTGGRLSAGTKAARSALASAEASLRDATDDVQLKAEDALLAWIEAWDYLGVAKSSLDASEARAWLVRKQYLAGQSSYFEWRNVEEQLISEQNQYLAAGRSLAVSAAAFGQAIGE